MSTFAYLKYEKGRVLTKILLDNSSFLYYAYNEMKKSNPYKGIVPKLFEDLIDASNKKIVAWEELIKREERIKKENQDFLIDLEQYNKTRCSHSKTELVWDASGNDSWFECKICGETL